MPQSSLFRWREGRGWLVLSGGGDFRQDETLDIDSRVLRLTISEAPLALIWSAGDIEIADRYLGYLDDLGSRTGYLLDPLTETSDAEMKQLSESGLIILMDGGNADALQNALTDKVLTAIETAHQNGATVYAHGQTAAFFGTWHPAPLIGLQAGLGWLAGALLVSPYEDRRAEQMKIWLQDNTPEGYGLGIGKGSALALGGVGEVETLGNGDITIMLGKNLTTS